MGNCTSKKSGKFSKITLSTLPFSKMNQPHGSKNDTRGLSTKIAPTSKGQATSFGFKRRPGPVLPAPVTLTSRVNEMRQSHTADAHSGSSVESLCHVANRSSPVVTPKVAASPTGASQSRRTPSPGAGAVNRFGFRSATPPKGPRQSPGRGLQTTPRSSPASRSKSAVCAREARAAFFKDYMQPAGSANSILGSQADVANAMHPGKFWLQTSQLPRPQYPIRLADKAYKTATNTSRRDGPGASTSDDVSSSKDTSVTDDSGIGSHAQALSDSETQAPPIDQSSPINSRGRTARKLELRMVDENKFELLDMKDRQLGKPTFVKTPRAAQSTGLVQQRTQQYLQRITRVTDSNRAAPLADCESLPSPGENTESEEEKLKKDSRRSEKNSCVSFLMNEGTGDDELLPGEAMADDITLSFSSDEDMSISKFDETVESRRAAKPALRSSEAAIRSDALRLSHCLRSVSDSSSRPNSQVSDSFMELLNAEERSILEEETLLELSSESDTSADKDSAPEKVIVTLNTSTILNTSTESPGTPSNGSMSEGRDFLIDDEIADQPQLCFSTHEDLNLDKVLSLNNNQPETNDQALDNDAVQVQRLPRRASVGTLSPCESLMSDDLIMDFENSHDRIDRCGGSGTSADGDCDNVSMDGAQWDLLTRNGTRLGANVNGKMGGSVGSSPASHRSGGGGGSRASTDEDLSIRLDKSSCQHMFQDIVSIKSMLLKLNKVLSETDSLGGACTDEDESTADLKKQVAFLQQQLHQREKSLQALQAELSRHTPAATLCNAATQTDKVRPVSSALLQNLPSDNNIVTNGANRKVAEWIEENNRQSLMKIAPADKILEKVKELSFKPVDVLERERAERRAVCGKNVFKITKIDLVLKSDNYGQNELRKS